MSTILDVLLIVHFIGLMMGAGGGLGSSVVAGYAKTQPEERAAPLKELGPRLAGMSMAGLVLMHVTGIALLVVKYEGNLAIMPAMFWVKLVFVGTLTVGAIMIHVTYAHFRRGNAAAEARLPVFGAMAGMSAFAAVIFAVLAFH